MASVFLGKLTGLYLVAISIALLADRRRALGILDEMVRSPAWMLFSGMVATAAGLAVVLGHQVWHGGTLPVLVTLTGWIILLKGLALLLVPPGRMAALYGGLGLDRHFHLWIGTALLFGLFIAALAFSR